MVKFILITILIAHQGAMAWDTYDIRDAVGLVSDDEKAHRLLKDGKVKEAIQLYKQLLMRPVVAGPNYATNHYNLGFALAKDGKIAESLAHFEIASHTSSLNGDKVLLGRCYYNLAYSYFLMAQSENKHDKKVDYYEEALSYFKKAIRSGNPDVIDHSLLYEVKISTILEQQSSNDLRSERMVETGRNPDSCKEVRSSLNLDSDKKNEEDLIYELNSLVYFGNEETLSFHVKAECGLDFDNGPFLLEQLKNIASIHQLSNIDDIQELQKSLIQLIENRILDYYPQLRAYIAKLYIRGEKHMLNGLSQKDKAKKLYLLYSLVEGTILDRDEYSAGAISQLFDGLSIKLRDSAPPKNLDELRDHLIKKNQKKYSNEALLRVEMNGEIKGATQVTSLIINANPYVKDSIDKLIYEMFQTVQELEIEFVPFCTKIEELESMSAPQDNQSILSEEEREKIEIQKEKSAKNKIAKMRESKLYRELAPRSAENKKEEVKKEPVVLKSKVEEQLKEVEEIIKPPKVLSYEEKKSIVLEMIKNNHIEESDKFEAAFWKRIQLSVLKGRGQIEKNTYLRVFLDSFENKTVSLSSLLELIDDTEENRLEWVSDSDVDLFFKLKVIQSLSSGDQLEKLKLLDNEVLDKDLFNALSDQDKAYFLDKLGDYFEQEKFDRSKTQKLSTAKKYIEKRIKDLQKLSTGVSEKEKKKILSFTINGPFDFGNGNGNSKNSKDVSSPNFSNKARVDELPEGGGVPMGYYSPRENFYFKISTEHGMENGEYILDDPRSPPTLEPMVPLDYGRRISIIQRSFSTDTLLLPDRAKIISVRDLETGKDYSDLVKWDTKQGVYKLKEIVKRPLEIVAYSEAVPYLKDVRKLTHEVEKYYLNSREPINLKLGNGLEDLIKSLKRKLEKAKADERDAAYQEAAIEIKKWINANIFYSTQKAAVQKYEEFHKGLKSNPGLNLYDFMLMEKVGDCDIHNGFLTTLLVNHLGIPARQTSGYNASNGVIKTGDGHGITEIWLESRGGWVSFDATSSNILDGEESTSSLGQGGFNFGNPLGDLFNNDRELDHDKLERGFQCYLDFLESEVERQGSSDVLFTEVTEENIASFQKKVKSFCPDTFRTLNVAAGSYSNVQGGISPLDIALRITYTLEGKEGYKSSRFRENSLNFTISMMSNYPLKSISGSRFFRTIREIVVNNRVSRTLDRLDITGLSELIYKLISNSKASSEDLHIIIDGIIGELQLRGNLTNEQYKKLRMDFLSGIKIALSDKNPRTVQELRSIVVNIVGSVDRLQGEEQDLVDLSKDIIELVFERAEMSVNAGLSSDKQIGDIFSDISQREYLYESWKVALTLKNGRVTIDPNKMYPPDNFITASLAQFKKNKIEINGKIPHLTPIDIALLMEGDDKTKIDYLKELISPSNEQGFSWKPILFTNIFLGNDEIKKYQMTTGDGLYKNRLCEFVYQASEIEYSDDDFTHAFFDLLTQGVPTQDLFDLLQHANLKNIEDRDLNTRTNLSLDEAIKLGQTLCERTVLKNEIVRALLSRSDLNLLQAEYLKQYLKKIDQLIENQTLNSGLDGFSPTSTEKGLYEIYKNYLFNIEGLGLEIEFNQEWRGEDIDKRKYKYSHIVGLDNKQFIEEVYGIKNFESINDPSLYDQVDILLKDLSESDKNNPFALLDRLQVDKGSLYKLKSWYSSDNPAKKNQVDLLLSAWTQNKVISNEKNLSLIDYDSIQRNRAGSTVSDARLFLYMTTGVSNDKKDLQSLLEKIKQRNLPKVYNDHFDYHLFFYLTSMALSYNKVYKKLPSELFMSELIELLLSLDENKSLPTELIIRKRSLSMQLFSLIRNDNMRSRILPYLLTYSDYVSELNNFQRDAYKDLALNLESSLYELRNAQKSIKSEALNRLIYELEHEQTRLLLMYREEGEHFRPLISSLENFIELLPETGKKRSTVELTQMRAILKPIVFNGKVDQELQGALLKRIKSLGRKGSFEITYSEITEIILEVFEAVPYIHNDEIINDLDLLVNKIVSHLSDEELETLGFFLFGKIAKDDYELNDSLRILSNMMQNYGKKEDFLRMLWSDDEFQMTSRGKKALLFFSFEDDMYLGLDNKETLSEGKRTGLFKMKLLTKLFDGIDVMEINEKNVEKTPSAAYRRDPKFRRIIYDPTLEAFYEDYKSRGEHKKTDSLNEEEKLILFSRACSLEIFSPFAINEMVDFKNIDKNFFKTVRGVEVIENLRMALAIESAYYYSGLSLSKNGQTVTYSRPAGLEMMNLVEKRKIFIEGETPVNFDFYRLFNRIFFGPEISPYPSKFHTDYSSQH